MIEFAMNDLDKNNIKFTICHHCGQENQIVDLGSYKKGLCSQCFSSLYYKHSKLNFKFAFIYALTALILFIPSNIYPIMSFELVGNEFSVTFIQSAIALHDQGFDFVSLVIFLTAFVFPIMNSFVVITIYLKKIGILDFIKFKSLNKMYNFTKKTSFVEVYLLAIVVGYIKLDDISDVIIHDNIYFFIAYIIFFRLSMNNIHTTREFLSKKKFGNSYSLTFALIITGLLLYIPANYFTMMNISKFGNITPDTIMSGIMSLANNGMIEIAIIIFIASIVIPLFKLLGMLFILLSMKYNFYNNRINKIYKLKLYKFIDFIGKWSILDIYMVALLTSLIKEESIAFIEAGSAVTYFTMVILITIVATTTFDTKLIWNKNE
ncbi:hypothetical protein DZA31_00185 [Arcobacter sp. HD9-500m-PIT-SAG02]|nr:hypothetical protein DZA31_00185 [Arcobacter sp. HD9-500m-PIT-SAG02]